MKNSDTTPQQGIGRSVGGAIGGALDTAIGTALESAGFIGQLIGSSFRLLPGLHGKRTATPPYNPGTPPGIEHLSDVHQPPETDVVEIRCTDYNQERIETFLVTELEKFLTEKIPEWARVRWINVKGVHPYVVNRFREAFGFHILAAEDVLRVSQRPRVESYDDHLFVITQLLYMQEDSFNTEQISMFIKPGMLITFQQSFMSVFQPIRERLSNANYRIRQRDTSYLAYSVLDTVVDHAFPVIERYSDILQELEEALIASQSSEVLQRIYSTKRDLMVLWRLFIPMRELTTQLGKEDQLLVSEISRTYLRDVYDHCVQIIDVVEAFRDMAGSLTDLYISLTSNRTNDVMRVLTIIATIFIPITFFAGVYGMNFDHIPELKWRFAYPAFWAGCAAMVSGLFLYFHRKGWLKNQ